MLFSELHKIVVNKVTFVCFKGAIAPIDPLDPPLLHTKTWMFEVETWDLKFVA